ncbi:YgdB family protein [Chania multitudinisentens]
MRVQQGGSTLAAVMLLLVMGLMLLNAQQRQLDSALLLAVDQQRYLRAYNQAVSALNWGLVQSWPREQLTTARWQCQQLLADTLQACARRSSRPGIVLVRGAGIIPESEPLWLYQLAAETSAVGDIRLQTEEGGWLDFCPEKKESDCAD